MKLGVQNLPESASGLLSGRLYCVTADSPSLLRHIASETLAQNEHSALVSEQATQEYLQGRARDQWLAGKLPALRLRLRNTPANERRTERLLRELSYHRFNRLRLVIIDPAEGLLNLQNEQEATAHIESYRHWAAEADCSLLLMYPQLLQQPECLSSLMSLADQFAGIVRLNHHEGQSVWNTTHWFSHVGMHGQQVFTLREQDDQLQANALELREPGVEASAAALDEETVYVTEAAVDDSADMPRRWRKVADIAELVEASRDAIGATLVLDFSPGDTFESCARQIYELRQRHGRQLKLVVRERGAIIRHQQEQQLLRLGASLVVPNSVEFTRLVSMLESLVGQIFTRPLDVNLVQTISHVELSEKIGYLPMASFLNTADKTLKDAHDHSIACAIVSLQVLPGITTLDALRETRLKRPGDICTADNTHVHLFLFACRESDISLTLKHVLRLPVNALFLDHLRLFDHEAMLDFLLRLRMNQNQNTADYSVELKELADASDDVVDEQQSKPKHPVAPGFNPLPPTPAIAFPLQPRKA